MDTALNPAAAHRSDARLHVLTPSSSTSPQTLKVRAIFHLSEAGRRASLLTGGNGRRRQRLGQKTEEVYRRYAIVDEAMIREAAVKMNRGAKVRRNVGGGTPQATGGQKTLNG